MALRDAAADYLGREGLSRRVALSGCRTHVYSLDALARCQDFDLYELSIECGDASLTNSRAVQVSTEVNECFVGLQYASKMSESTLNLTSFRLVSAYGGTLPERHAEPHGETRSLSRASVKDMPPCLMECTGFRFFERFP